MIMKRPAVSIALSSILGFYGGLSAAPVQAASFTVTIDTTNLTSQPFPPAPFSLEFQLNDGGGTVTNTVTLSNFDFGAGGGATGTPSYECTSGTGPACNGVSGDLSGTVILSDGSDFFNQFTQPFTPSAIDPLRFLLDLTTNGELPASDAFSLAILDGQGLGIPTDFFDTFILIDLAAPPTVATYGSIPNPLGLEVPAPIVQAASVPEPGTLALLAIGIGGMLPRWRLSGRSCRRHVGTGGTLPDGTATVSGGRRHDSEPENPPHV